MSLDVVVVGNAGVDTDVYLAGLDAGGRPDLGRDANFTENLDVVGQAGGYASRGFAALGRQVAFVGALGDDWAGRLVRKAFDRDGVDLSGVFPDPAGTARSVNLMAPDGRRWAFYDGKSHLQLRPDPAPAEALFARARLAHFSIPDWARQLLPVARRHGVVVSVDLQDVVDLDDPYRRDFVEHADVLFCSAAHVGDVPAAVRHLLGTHPHRVVVVGMGAHGCAVGSHTDGIHLLEPFPLDRPVVDTNGAGDSLAVGFLDAYVLDGRPLLDAARRGQAAARWCCTLRGTSDGLITRLQLDGLAP